MEPAVPLESLDTRSLNVSILVEIIQKWTESNGMFGTDCRTRSNAVNGDLKLKRCSAYEEGYKKARMETQRDYRAMLMLMRDQIAALYVYHDAELDVHSLYSKLKLLNHYTREAELKSEKEKLESELRLAEAKLADLKVPVIDWYKLGEPGMYE
ncbi:hypothetical protein Bca4012_010051 [Brassica carinata]